MAQVEGEASRTLHEQCVIHASAQEALTREATSHNAADRQTAQAAFAEMQQRDILREQELSRLLAVLKRHKKHSAERNVSES